MDPLKSVPRLLLVLVSALSLIWVVSAYVFYQHDRSAQQQSRNLNRYHFPTMRASGEVARLVLEADVLLRDFDGSQGQAGPNRNDVIKAEIAGKVAKIGERVAEIAERQEAFPSDKYAAAVARLAEAWSRSQAQFEAFENSADPDRAVLQSSLGQLNEAATQIEQLHINPARQLVEEITSHQDSAEITILKGLALLVIISATISYGTVRAIVATAREQSAVLRKLNERERSLSEAQSLANIGSWDWDLVSGEHLWTEGNYHLLGLDPADGNGNYDLFMEHVHPDDRHIVEKAIERANTSGEPYSAEHRIIRADGEIRYITERADVERDADGNPVRMRGLKQDITDRKLAEIALQESEERYARAASGTNDGIWDWNIETGENYFSPRWAEILGYEPDELSPRAETFMELVHPGDLEYLMRKVRSHFEGHESYDVEIRLRHKSGDYVWVNNKGKVAFDDDGNPVRMAGSITDITERKMAEEEIRKLNKELEQRVEERTRQLREEKEFTERLIDTARVIIMVLDREGRIVQFNPYFEQLSGYALRDVEGQSWMEVYAPTGAQGDTESIFEDVVRGKDAHGIVTELVVKSGDIRRIEWFGARLENSDKEMTGVLAIGQDVTDRLELQAQLVQSSKLATLGEMATGVAHELNQPLGVIRFACDNILRRFKKGKHDPDYVIEKLTRIIEQVKRATDIIDHMRIFGRKPDREPTAVYMADAVNGALNLMGEQLKLAEIEIVTSGPVNCPAIRGHQVQIEQVLLNLLTNARDAILGSGKSGERRITIRGTCEEGTDTLRVSVRDSGAGIDSSKIDRIFEPFYTTKEVGVGTGLGLSISYGIITEMGGRIEARNHPEGGAEFMLELPIIQEAKIAV